MIVIIVIIIIYTFTYNEERIKLKCLAVCYWRQEYADTLGRQDTLLYTPFPNIMICTLYMYLQV